MTISNPEIKKLYGLSAGRCSLCKIDVFENDVHIGEMAHIIANSINGPRGSDDLFNDRNSYKNLILLCANHHSEVDKNPYLYSAEKLQRIKYEHERNIASLFEAPQGRRDDVNFLKYFMKFVPFTRLRYFVEHLPRSVNLDLCDIGDMFDALCIDNPHLYPLNDKNLQYYFDAFMKNYYDLWGVISGCTSIDGRLQANFSQADERFYLHMERKYLPYDAIVELDKELDILKSGFITSYMQLIEFIRNNYKEVSLNSYDQV